MAADYKTLLGLVREFVARYDAAPQDSIKPDFADLLERARAAIVPAEPKNDPKILHMMAVDDPCCPQRFQAAGRKGLLDKTDRWECPRCGTAWRARSLDDEPNVRHWDAEATLEAFHLP